MEDAIKQNLIRLGVRQGDTLGMAVSSGADSIVLLSCAVSLREHGIREQESKNDMAFVEAQCSIRCITDSADVPAMAQVS